MLTVGNSAVDTVIVSNSDVSTVSLCILYVKVMTVGNSDVDIGIVGNLDFSTGVIR
jgi:hypothetical protein